MYQGENHCGTESSIIIYQVSQSSPPIFSSKPPNSYLHQCRNPKYMGSPKWIFNLSLGSLKHEKNTNPKFRNPKNIRHPQNHLSNPKSPVGQHRIEDFLQQGHILGLQALLRSLEPSSQRWRAVVVVPSSSGLLLRSSKIHTRYLVYIYILYNYPI